MKKVSTTSEQSGPIVLFDGVCNLCHGTVQFIIQVDHRARFRFASLQSDAGARLLKESGYQGPPLDSVVLVYRGKLWTHSDAVLEIARLLGKGWALAYTFKLIPRSIRDSIYRWIAKNRYAWFGKKESCMLPTPNLKSRFL